MCLATTAFTVLQQVVKKKTRNVMKHIVPNIGWLLNESCLEEKGKRFNS
jgi:pantothenate kinase